jgi:lipopolysaccharide transport system ATP-binding protein
VSGIAIRADNLKKRYRLGAPPRHRTLRDSIAGLFRNPWAAAATNGAAGDGTFWALQDVSFELAHGEILGIVGRNGAGKSTLLKILSRITRPTAGEATIHGRVASLLEVGTGFHPELTGRENIFLNGAILGMKKAEIKSKFDEIVAFAEIDKFVDTPVKRYSSGMYVRLAFAVAAHLEPDILIVDEVLAVGDMRFQKKCLGKMNEVSRGGRTVLFVSHSLASIENLCRRGIVLDGGGVVFDGPVRDAVDHYVNAASVLRNPDGHVIDLTNAPNRRSRAGNLLQRIELYSDGDSPVVEGLRLGASLKVRVHFHLPNPAADFDVRLGFEDLFGQLIFTARTLFEPTRPLGEISGDQVFTCEIPSFTLMPATYVLRVMLYINNTEADAIGDAAYITVTGSDYYGTGNVPNSGKFVLPHRWVLERSEDGGDERRRLTGVVAGG